MRVRTVFLLARLEGLNYAQIARELGIGEPDVNRYDREQFVIGSEAAFELNDVWTLRQNARYVYVDDRYVAQFDNGLTPYISYAESFLPQTGTDASGSPFEPASGKQYEVGIKYEPEAIDGFTPLSVYRIDQENMLTTDLANPMFSPPERCRTLMRRGAGRQAQCHAEPAPDGGRVTQPEQMAQQRRRP